ncbi:MAG: carbohydrate binding domain-containing protein, partial [Planctomycetota bacterium]
MYTSMFRKAMLGDTATLSLDFTAGTVPTEVTFTRADSTARATYIDASGYVKTVASAGAARFDYTGGVAKGLLIEAAATNLAPYSNGSTTGWGTGGNRTPTNNTGDITDPANGNNATKLVLGTAGNYASYATSISGLTGGATYTVSYWIRGPATHSPRMYAQNGTVGDLTPSATTGTYSNTGWNRLTQTYTLPASTTQVLVYFMSANIATTGETYYVYGFQLETGSTASSLIHTTTSSLTRLADDAVIRSTAWTGLYSKPGTIVVEYYRGEYGAGDRSVLAIDTAATKHIHLKHAPASAASGIYNSAGSGVANKAAGNASGLNKACFSW